MKRRFGSKVFLDVAEIKDHLLGFQIFDARYNLRMKDYGRIEFAKGHASRSIRVDLDEELCGPLTGHARHPLPGASDFVEWCKSRGISQERPVLCYDDDCGAMGACRLWWMLDSLGVEAYVLNGGIQAYRAAGLPLESGDRFDVFSLSFWPYETEFSHHVRVEEIPPEAVLVDARSAARFHSTVRPYGPDRIPGHIEGAVNLPYQSHLVDASDNKILRDPDELRSNVLRALHGAWGWKDGLDLSNCVFYCGSGVSACINIAIVHHLGLGKPFLYCGSWSEYCGVHRFPLLRRLTAVHGMYFDMHSANLGDHPLADVEVTPIVADGSACENPDSDIKAAVRHLHLGETAKVVYQNGRVVVLHIPLRK